MQKRDPKLVALCKMFGSSIGEEPDRFDYSGSGASMVVM